MNKLTVKQALAWSDKHKKLKGEGARVVHIKQLIARAVKSALDAVELEEKEVVVQISTKEFDRIIGWNDAVAEQKQKRESFQLNQPLAGKADKPAKS